MRNWLRKWTTKIRVVKSIDEELRKHYELFLLPKELRKFFSKLPVILEVLEKKNDPLYYLAPEACQMGYNRAYRVLFNLLSFGFTIHSNMRAFNGITPDDVPVKLRPLDSNRKAGKFAVIKYFTSVASILML